MASGAETADAQAETTGTSSERTLTLLLSAAMFILVVDTSFMNVSISAVVHDLGTTASNVQSTIALEALVSAAFILIGGRVADLIGRRRAYVIGLLGYAIGALAMVLSQSLLPVIICWAVIGGLGASLLLPSMQALVHGNFSGDAQKRAYAAIGAAATVAAAVGPLLGGFITTYLSWRVAFGLEDVVIVVILLGIKLVRDVEYTGERGVDVVGSLLSVVGMGAVVLGILVWQEGGDWVVGLIVLGLASLVGLARWLVRRTRERKPALLDPNLFRSKVFRYGVSAQTLQQITLGGTMIALPIYLQMVLQYDALESGLSLAPLSLSMFAVALAVGRRKPKRRASALVRAGFALVLIGLTALIPIVPRATSGWYLVVPLLVMGCGLGLLVSRLNAYTLSPISEELVSEAAGVNSAGGSFGLSFGLAFAGAIMLWTLSASFTSLANDSTVLNASQQQQVSKTLEHDAEVMSNTALQKQIQNETPAVQNEILRINTDASHRALQVALLIPTLAALLGFINSFRMLREPEPVPSSAAEAVLGG